MGEKSSQRQQEVRALKAGIDLGMNLIDTAEMYGEGGAERVVADATVDCRDRVFIISKVYPHNASSSGIPAACHRSLQRLATDRIDLYLLHWRGSTPLEETVAAFEKLRQEGKIRAWGVSNFDTEDMSELIQLPDAAQCTTNQVLYNLSRRGIEWSLIPWCRSRNIPIMAYSPIEQGRLLFHPALDKIAQNHSATPAQVALAWLLAQQQIISIPKTANLEHLKEIRASTQVRLSEQDLTEMNRIFPAPNRPVPLEIL